MPDGWAFARINSLFFIQTGASFKKEQATSDFTQTRILRGGNILQGEYRFFENDIFVDSKLIQDSIILKNNDLITPAVTSIENIGKLARIEKDYEDVTAGGFVFIVRPCYNSDIFAKYMLYALQSSYFNKQLKSITKKSGQAFYNLGKERFIQLIIPIPPLNEQVRIVESIEQFTPLIKEYDKLEQQATKLDGEIYDKLKKSILQHAIQGKLVPQNSNDEPASVLLERIRAEKKAQLGKKYVESYIYKGDDNCYYEKVGSETKNITDEIPFDIPDSWTWCRLEQIIDFSKNISTSASEIPDSAWVLDLEDIEKDSGRILTKKRMIDIKSKSDKHKFFKGNVLYSKLRPYLNKVVVANENGYCTSEILVFNFTPIYNIYAQIFLMSPYFVAYAMAGAYGVKMPRIGSERGNNALMPLPPLAEQKLIVERINAIFSKLKDEI